MNSILVNLNRKILVFTSIILVSLLFSISGNAQIVFEKSYFFVGGSYGLYSPSEKNFSNVYEGGFHLPAVIVGIGYGNFSVVGKYRQFKTTGISEVKNLSAKGVADWKQEFYSAGVRIFNSNPVYVDICFVETHVTEKIGTINPVLTELASESTLKDQGMSFTVGAFLPIIHKKIYLSADFDYTYLDHRVQLNDYENKNISLGGISFNIGLVFGLEY